MDPVAQIVVVALSAAALGVGPVLGWAGFKNFKSASCLLWVGRGLGCGGEEDMAIAHSFNSALQVI